VVKTVLSIYTAIEKSAKNSAGTDAGHFRLAKRILASDTKDIYGS
jgi:hypothetical protein